MYKLTNTQAVIRVADSALIPDDDDNIDYEHWLQWITDGNTPAAADIPPPLTPLQQIRALEQLHDDDQRKLNRQAAIDVALSVACRNVAAAGKTREQVHTIYYATNRGYKALVDLEAACAALRKLIV